MVGGSDVSGEKLKLHGNYFPGGSISPSLSLSSLCIGGKTIFVESDPTEGRKKAEIGGLVYWLETDRTGSNKLVEASRRNQRCKWPVGPHKESRIRKEGKKFFFSPPRFSPRHALGPGQIFDLSSLETRREAGV